MFEGMFTEKSADDGGRMERKEKRIDDRYIFNVRQG